MASGKDKYGLKRSSGVDYSQVLDRQIDDDRFERQRAIRAAAAAPPVEKAKPSSSNVATPQSATMDAFMRMMTGKEERTIADRISDPNRPTWEQYKKENADKLDLSGNGEKEMKEYRKKLDAAREKALARGNSSKKKKKKHKKRSRSSSEDNSSSDDDHRRSKRKSRKKKKSHKRRRTSSDSETSDSDSDREDDRSRRRKRSKKSKKSGTGAVGIAAAMLLRAGRVVLTDMDNVRFIMQENARLSQEDDGVDNHVVIDVEAYEWGQRPSKKLIQEAYPDLILVSDCILPRLYPIEPLVEALVLLSRAHTRILISYEHRHYQHFQPKQRFWELMQEQRFSLRVIDTTEYHPHYVAADIEIWEIIPPPIA
ncbi:hypothetical protein BBO99_00001048 [Phytophthora kernoviae]|uniref:Uncharacterized protein n=1 Tax=Phytophthora kernoviae TaxID=325452 RepID=A0A3R7J1T7_9STRA|nr:hypothetical protein JM18_000326 [Phytophthora kernoviae]RLN06730.1 hypothetical protein BBI17_001019 [Phytophthora kernoviae]RLN84766.1 hypothetical protein BBO99_00001048 [Phytophthora kernoviae]